mgnify:CR=1 FL=1
MIGDGAVIGTRALVTKDVEPYAIVGGNPAKEIREWFDDTDIAMLLNVRCWGWTDDRLKAMSLLTTGDVATIVRLA